MNVNRYIFQSPYSSQIQVGRPDSMATQDNASKDILASSETKAKDLQPFDNAEAQKTDISIEQTIKNSSTIDVYA